MADIFKDWNAYGTPSDHLARTVDTAEKTARVTYRNDTGDTFRAIVRQKPNPIGFRATLPGDRRAK